MAKYLDLKKLHSFLTIAETGSFARAAQLLNYSPATITVQIQQLEQELGTCLFDRIGKKIFLTNDGHRLYSYAQKLLCLCEETTAALCPDTSLPGGRLRIGTIHSLCLGLLPSLLRRFHQKYPEVCISVASNTPVNLYDQLLCNDLDIVMVLDEPVCRAEFATVLQLPMQVVFCAAPDHPLCTGRNISLDELLSYPCILTEKDASYRRTLEHALAEHQRQISPILESDDTGLIIQLLTHGMGYSVLPQFLIQDALDSGALVSLPVPDLSLQLQLQIFYHAEKFIAREMRLFLMEATDYLSHLYGPVPDQS